MSVNSGNGGVRNLRAMFENKGDLSTSPPSRGRSPSGSINSGSSRQVSKVRASFVAVERPSDITSGQPWGLRKASDVSSMAEVRENEGLAQTSTIDNEKSPTSPHTSKHSIDGGLGSILKGSSFDGTPQKTKVAPKPSGPANKQHDSTTSSGVGPRASNMIKKMQASKDKPQPPPTSSAVAKSDAKPVKNPHPKPTVKPTPSSPRSPRLEKSSPKSPSSPAMAKSLIRGGPAKIRGVMDSAKRASEDREALRKEAPKPASKKEPEIKPKTEKKLEVKPVSNTETKPQPKANGVRKEPVSATTAKSAGPRSPTKPTKLPSGATAMTTAAAAKHDSHAHVQQPAKRSAPRASLPATQSRAIGGTTASGLHRSSRASLAPNGTDRPKSRVSTGKPEEGFLARMMRPTQSSSQKTHDKAQPESPPRSKAAAAKAPIAARRNSKSARKSDQTESQGDKLDEVPEAPAGENTADPAPGGLDEVMPVTPQKQSSERVNGTPAVTAGA